jgi:hypothetical protein
VADTAARAASVAGLGGGTEAALAPEAGRGTAARAALVQGQAAGAATGRGTVLRRRRGEAAPASGRAPEAVIDLTHGSSSEGSLSRRKKARGRNEQSPAAPPPQKTHRVLAGCRVSVTGFGQEGKISVAQHCERLGAVYRPGRSGGRVQCTSVDKGL